ncbi:two-component sensor histidine kinase [Helicobacter saguini]|uniref:histidine kinase n=1 Tax=Helicobacter saguini TaxID=1548018 RepID=A0A347VS80_9HELI|nr:ATP-binding protein [Helicobacter saguini]MWV62618.1 two-component sensor histidine kinase [Helicobacter saguini]MWV66710.1 two-component sensor histidine kinase [Helicobacter saguini]MWV69060.1 two-component sensor histidine kinase [Helicobacter saguini]MWV71386.1 two-component sensor histidine kinase [Helicobacter saguini]TLD94017.1 two-component sensor histidine kinase [Helicobacter saguini]
MKKIQRKIHSKNTKKQQHYKDEKLSKNTITLEEYKGDEAKAAEIKNALELGGDTQSLLNLLHELILQSYKIEKEFKDFKVLIESVLEMIPQAVLVFNDNGSLFYQNKKASVLSGLQNIDFSELTKSGEMELKIDNNTYLVQSSKVSHKQIITATNITEQKRQERLANMGQVSAHLAHEIRNPIGSISLLAGVLSKRVDADSMEIVNEMKSSIWRVERIIKSTLLFSKGVQAKRQLCNVGQFKESLEQVISEYGYTKEIDFAFELRYSGDLMVDFSLFEIVLHNMLCNAIDAIEEGECEKGEIKICFFKESGSLDSNILGIAGAENRAENGGENSEFIVCRIYDNGKEIEDINSLFEAFKTTKLKGHGLGLALSQQIATAHNGVMSASNATPTHGKFFEIKVPN